MLSDEQLGGLKTLGILLVDMKSIGERLTCPAARAGREEMRIPQHIHMLKMGGGVCACRTNNIRDQYIQVLALQGGQLGDDALPNDRSATTGMP